MMNESQVSDSENFLMKDTVSGSGNLVMKDTLVLGIGNYLMKDEGVGVHFIKYLERFPLPFDIEILDGGTGGFHLLEYFEIYKNIIIIDATLDDLPAGTIQCIHPRYTADFPRAMSTHDIGLKDLVTVLQILDKMPQITLFIVSIDSVQEQGTELNAEIEYVLPLLRAEIVFHFTPKESLEKPANQEAQADRF